MNRLTLMTTAILALAALPCDAQVRTRWRLEFTHTKPRIHTYRNPLGKAESYWYITYTIKNNSGMFIPINLDIDIYGSAGKDNLHDVDKVDIDALKAVLADRLSAEEYRFGQYIQDSLVPESVEFSIIEKDARLGRRSPGIVMESIKAFKADKKYLNKREMRERLFIKDGDTFHGLAVFRRVDPRHKMLTLQVSGLVDFVKIARFDPDKGPIYEYENRMRWTRYRFPGDVFDRQNDVLTFDAKGWESRRIGPASSKDGLELMISEMVAELRTLKKLQAAGKPLPQTPAIKASDMAIIMNIVRAATGLKEREFPFDDAQSVLENEDNIWRMHEWWLTNKSKLAFERGSNRFVIVEEELPGTTAIDEEP